MKKKHNIRQIFDYFTAMSLSLLLLHVLFTEGTQDTQMHLMRQ